MMARLKDLLQVIRASGYQDRFRVMTAVDFSNVVVVMTSNLPGEPIEYFRPEFVNRIDEIIRFRTLGEADIRHIVTIQVELLRKRMADRRISLDITDAALGHIAHVGEFLVRTDPDAEGRSRDCLVPAVAPILASVDLRGRVAVIDPPPGLLDP